jgi:choice-of-anchor A domain-containing protein
MTDTNVVNGTTYCYQAITFDSGGRRTVGLAPSCAMPKADPLPPHGLVSINNGQRVTVSPNVTLTLWASDSVDPEQVPPGDEVLLPPDSSASGVKEMLIGNRSDLSDGVWEPYATTKRWRLAQASGRAAVYVKYRDAAGNESDPAIATIEIVPLDLSVCVTSPLGLANDFNLLVFGNLTQSGTDVQGRVAVGGNAQLNSYSVGSRLSNSRGSRDDLIVDSRLVYTDGTVANGNVTYGGTLTLTRVAIPNGRARQGHPLNFAAEQLNLELRSTAWGSMTPNGTTSVQYFGGSTAQITLTGNNPRLNIFALAGKDLAAANSLTIRTPAASTVVVNIDGQTAQMKNFGFTISGTDRQRVLYNFFEARSLSISSIGVQGSILAPYAAVNFSNGAIDGTLIGASLSGSGQAHLFRFQGCLPIPRQP